MDKAHHSLLVNRNDHAWAAGLWVLGAPLASAATGVAAKLLLLGRLQVSDTWKARRAKFFLVVLTAAVMPFLFTPNASATGAKAGSPCSFLCQRHAAIHGRVHGIRD